MPGDSNGPIFRQICAAVTVNVLSIYYGFLFWNIPNNLSGSGEVTPDKHLWPAAAAHLGGFVGIFIWNYVADEFGRKINGYALALTQIIGWLGLIFSTSIIQLIIFWFIMSLGNIGLIICSQLYVNETANEKIKGPLCAFLIISMQIGYLFRHICTFAFMFSDNTLNIICLALPVVFVLLYFWLPESPLYFLMHRKQDQAEKVLLWFNNGNIRAVEEKMKALTHSIDNNEKPPSLKHLFADQQTNRASLTAIIMLAGYRLCGYSVISFKQVELLFNWYNNAIYVHTNVFIAYMVVDIIQLITACVMVLAGKYAPKRLVMGVSYGVASLSLACISFFFLWKDTKDLSAFNWVPTLCFVIFLICYSSGIGPVTFMILAEMTSARLLNNVICAGLFVSFSLTFVTGYLLYFLPNLFTSIYGLAMFYSLSNAAIALFVLIFVKDSSLKLVK